MKTPLTLGLLALLCFLSYSSAGPMGPQLVLDGSCCLQHSNMNIPMKKVKHLQLTPADCRLQSLIITTEKKKICLDASGDWARVLLENKKLKRLH